MKSTRHQANPTPVAPLSAVRSPCVRVAGWVSSLLIMVWLASPSAASDRFYIDLKGGQVDFHRGYEEQHAWDFRSQTTSPILAIGADLHSNLALEIGYQTADGFEGSGSACFPGPNIQCIEILATVEADLDLWTLTLLPQKTLGRFTILGRVGAAYHEEHVSVVQPGPAYLGRLTGTDLLLGAGIRLDLAPRLDLLLDYTEIDVGVETLSLGLGYRF